MGRLSAETYFEYGTDEAESTVTYRYDNNGALGSITDSATGITYRYHYDLTDRLMRYTETGEDYEAIVRYIYNTQNELIQTREIIDGHSRYTVVSYDDDNRIDTWRTGYAQRIYGYDEYGRVVTRNTKHTYGTVSDVMVESYGYLVKDGRETSYVSTYRTDTVGDYDVTYAYTYDANGNITSVTDGESITTYVYDSANQLLREDNQAAGKTWIYAYDNAGNILSKAEYAYTEDNLGEALDTATYTYGNSQWGDLLTGYHGNTITYTANGNPLNDGVWTYSWRHGRQLESMTAIDGSATWTYSYNKDGLRTQRANGEITYNYVYLGSQLKRMTVGTTEIYFSYDSDGSPMSMVYNGTTYYYVKNLQGDVVGIVTKTGEWLASYTYDAWGNPLETTVSDSVTNAAAIAANNPLRYRGYVYDTETGLYYLQSRYYNPEMGRFLNADALVSTGGLLGNNMFTYCLNNPICRSDHSGLFSLKDLWEDLEDLISDKYDEMKEELAENNGTLSGGFAASVSTGFWVFGVQIGVSRDTKGNVEFQWTPYGGTSTGTPSIDAGMYATVTNAPDVAALHGMGYNVGGTVAVGGALTIDGVFIPNSSGNDCYTGISIAGGAGAGGEVHVVWGETNQIFNWGYNVYDIIESIFPFLGE